MWALVGPILLIIGLAQWAANSNRRATLTPEQRRAEDVNRSIYKQETQGLTCLIAVIVIVVVIAWLGIMAWVISNA
jgi:hypothetical protein